MLGVITTNKSKNKTKEHKELWVTDMLIALIVIMIITNVGICPNSSNAQFLSINCISIKQ